MCAILSGDEPLILVGVPNGNTSVAGVPVFPPGHYFFHRKKIFFLL
jgi:hypothetical protein